MRLGLLSSVLGIESDDESLPDLIAGHAEQFVRAGGCVTLTEWAALSEDERAALIDARARVYGDEDVGDALDRAVSP